MENVAVVPTEPLAAKECAVCGLEMRTIDEVKAIDVTFAQPSECAVLTIGGKRTLASVFGREHADATRRGTDEIDDAKERESGAVEGIIRG